MDDTDAPTKPPQDKPTTPYTIVWPEWDNGSDAFSMEDSYLDRTGCTKPLTNDE